MKPFIFGPDREKGQAILLVIVGLSFLLIGALGLAIDGGQMYAHRQMAQTAADGAAEAGIMSIFAGTNATAPSPFGTGSPPAVFTCSIADGRTPCVYARRNGFGGTANDTVSIDFPATVAGAPLSNDPVPAIRVTVVRTLNTGLIRFLGPSTSSVRAVAVAAIVLQTAPVPLLVTHPTLINSVSLQGSPSLRVCGGPTRSVQVNSDSATAVSLKNVDLSHGGPNDPGNCTTGTGSDFAVFGGPATTPPSLLLGTTGNYDQPSAPMRDPYENIPAPAIPSPGQTNTYMGPGCPVAQCTLYSPGLFTKISVKNETAIFRPGLYYVNSGGFGNQANGNMLMATGYPADPNTGAGMVVYNTGAGVFDIGANATATLVGSDNNSFYHGILFFQDRDGVARTHTLGGGGSITLTGSLYMTNWLPVMQAQPSQYQTLSLQGNSGIQINGSIVVGALSMGGTPFVTFNLAAGATIQSRRAALVR